MRPMREPERVLVGSVVTGTHVEHYRRRWTMGPSAVHGHSLVGTIGVQSETGGKADLWDDQLNDFVEHSLPEGVKTPWAINLRTMRIAFQLRKGIDKRQGFAGAFRRLLNEAGGAELWNVEPETAMAEWSDWVEAVDRITRLTVSLDRPNPHYGDRDEIEEAIEASHARKIRLTVEAQEGESIDPDGPELLREGIEHADAGYGRYTAVAEVGGGTTRFDSRNRSTPPEVEVAADHESGDAFVDSLRRAVGDESLANAETDAAPYLENGDDGGDDPDAEE